MDEALAEFKKKNPDMVLHIKRGVIETDEDNNPSPMSNNDHSSALSLLSQEPTCHLMSESSFSTGDLQYPPVGQHLLSPTVRILQFQREAPPSAETTINPRLLSLPICHSMQRTPHTPLTSPSPTTPTTPQRTPSPALPPKSPLTDLSARTLYQSRHDHSWRSSMLWD